MTKRMYRIVYTSSVSDVSHEFTTDKLFEADERLEFLQSDIAKDMLGIRVIRHDWVDKEVSHDG